jgi:biotin carboxyl carrier protein
VKLRYLRDNQTVELEANLVDGVWSVTLPHGDSRVIDIGLENAVEGCVSFEVPESNADATARYTLPTARTERGIEISYLGRTFVFTVPVAGGAAKLSRPADSGSLTAPMVGVLSELFVAEGDRVAAYQPLAVVEAMKVMATIEAPFAGTVKRVYAAKGAQLTHGELIIEIEKA